MEFADLKRKSEGELQKLLIEKRNELREFRFKAGEGQLKNVQNISQNRKLIAKILTLLNSKRIEDVTKKTIVN